MAARATLKPSVKFQCPLWNSRPQSDTDCWKLGEMKSIQQHLFLNFSFFPGNEHTNTHAHTKVRFCLLFVFVRNCPAWSYNSLGFPRNTIGAIGAIIFLNLSGNHFLHHLNNNENTVQKWEQEECSKGRLIDKYLWNVAFNHPLVPTLSSF